MKSCTHDDEKKVPQTWIYSHQLALFFFFHQLALTAKLLITKFLVAQTVKLWTLDLGSSHDLRILRSSPASEFALHREPA